MLDMQALGYDYPIRMYNTGGFSIRLQDAKNREILRIDGYPGGYPARDKFKKIFEAIAQFMNDDYEARRKSFLVGDEVVTESEVMQSDVEVESEHEEETEREEVLKPVKRGRGRPKKQ